LETNKRQTLPHLTAAIKGITVSPTGASYAVQLDDNSVLVLSTSELAPTAMVGGLQTLGAPSKKNHQQGSSRASSRTVHSTPAVISSRFPNQLLLAVPANGGAEPDQVSMPFIQAYDWAVGRHISRQALARNNATNINVGPGGVTVKEAHITHLSISQDGEWLVSAETWNPETGSRSDEDQPKIQRRETFLKFWQWSDARDQWVLQTRIDAPHQSDTLDFANLILDLTSNPKSLEFTSIGQDGIVRVWSPKTRLKDGTIIRGVNQEGITTWVCSQAIDICKQVDITHPDTDSQFSGISSIGKVAYSDDGSVLAATVDEANTLSPGLVHFINVESGLVRSSQPLIYGTGLGSIKFLGRYLIVLSTELRVWDIVANKLVFGFPLIDYHLPISRIQTLSFIAVSPELDRFAVAFPAAKIGQVRTRIAVFDPASATPLIIEDLPTYVTSLVSLGASSGFAAIDTDAQIRIIKPDTGSTLDALKLGMVMDLENQDVDMEEALDTTAGAEEVEEDIKKDEYDSDDNDNIVEHKPTVKPHQLAEIFDSGPAFALPPVEDLFKAVASLYLGRPAKRSHPIRIKPAGHI
jgi:NET1-associated nuclear protein 1 (U3 small nucleolar RNA-associated protein 17)